MLLIQKLASTNEDRHSCMVRKEDKRIVDI